MTLIQSSSSTQRSRNDSSISRGGNSYKSIEEYVIIPQSAPTIPTLVFTKPSPLLGLHNQQWEENVKLVKKFLEGAPLSERYAAHNNVSEISLLQSLKNKEDILVGSALVSKALQIIELLNSQSPIEEDQRKEIYDGWKSLISDTQTYKASVHTSLDIPKCKLQIFLEFLSNSLNISLPFILSTWGWLLGVEFLVVSKIASITIPFILSTLAALIAAGTRIWNNLATTEKQNAERIQQDIFDPWVRYLETIIEMFPAIESESEAILKGQEQHRDELIHTKQMLSELKEQSKQQGNMIEALLNNMVKNFNQS